MTAPQRDEDGRILVNSLDEVPHFDNDEECAAFWDTHSPSEEYLRRYRLSADDPRARRLEELLPTRRKAGR